MAERKPKKAKYDPETIIHGWTMIYNTNPAGINTNLGAFPLYTRLLNYSWYEVNKTLAGTAVTPLQNALIMDKNFGAVILDFNELIQLYCYQNLYAQYQAGKITPGLVKILNHLPGHDTDVFNAVLDKGGFDEIVLNAVKSGEIDFTPFNDDGDASPDWFLKYRLSPVPIPGYFGTVDDLGKLVFDNDTLIERNKKRLKKELKNHVITALQNETPAETLLLLADDIKERYNELKDATETGYYNSVFPFNNPRSAGFVVDITANKIFDLRPYCEELRELLKPGAEPLKEFYYALKRYVTDALKKDKPTTERTPELIFENTPFLMMRNSRESNAIASVSGSMMQIAVQQELALTDKSGNALYNYTATAPTKSGEVIISVKETPKGGVLRPSTAKLQILFDTLFTRSGYREFIFPVDAYMELCKRTQGEMTPEARRNFRRKLRQDLQRMKNTKFSANLPGCRPGEIGILNAWLPAPNNTVYIKLESLYCDSLMQKNAGKMQMPQTIFKTNEQNPHLIPIMRALCRNRTDFHNINMEYAKPGSQRAHTISLKTLYEWDLSLPRWAKVSKGSRQFKRDIIEPLFNAIQELKDENYITAKYIDKDGTEHTEQEKKTAGIVDILDPEKWLLRYEVIGFKDDPEMVKSAMERAKERKEKLLQEREKKKAKKKKQ